ncbi:MAG: hypothetical protein PVG83_07540 [Acidimicrobiia bacterium]|jgi:hypothetical protein
MRDRITATLDTADLAIASCSGVLTDAELESVKTVVASLRSRLQYPDDVLVVALAGGTGSGKSSLFNVLAGDDLVVVGGVRPTTEVPVAAVPGSVGEALDEYLDHLDVTERHVYAGEGLCLIDLPDTDSVEVSHRHRVDALLPFVDVVAWVTDPEKYRDARLHDDYLRRFVAYAPQLVCVLNRCDRLDPDQLPDVLADFSEALSEDGLGDVPVVATAASPPSGPPLGVAELRDILESKRSVPETLYGKLLTDLEASTADLNDRLGATSLDFDERASDVLGQVARSLVDGDTESATQLLAGFLDGLATETGGPVAQRLTGIAAQVPGHVVRIVGEANLSGSPRRRWFRRPREEVPITESLQVSLSEAVVQPARVVLAKRALAVAALAELAVALRGLRSEASR